MVLGMDSVVAESLGPSERPVGLGALSPGLIEQEVPLTPAPPRGVCSF